MLKKFVFTATAFLFSLIIFQSCVYHKADEEYPFVCDTTVVRYKIEITAILNDHCQSCHYGEDAVSGINLYDHATISSLALDGQFTYGTLLSAVIHEGGAPEMPQGGPKLQDCDINKIAAWVHNGAPDN